MLEPTWARETAMRDEPMETEIDPERAEHVAAGDEKNDPGPAEEPWEKCQCRDQMADQKGVNRVALALHAHLTPRVQLVRRGVPRHAHTVPHAAPHGCGRS